jgi:FtsZ-interacting cell division protein ZipA
VLKEIQEHMKSLTATEERRVKAEERKTDVLEKISERLMDLAENTLSNKPATSVEAQPEPVAEKPPVQPASQPEPDPTKLSREEILIKIAAHRKESMSYERIARELESAGIPTLSGKGRWRGQTVHKLLKQMES